MSENELELIKIIRESEDPAKAMVTAIEIICDYINQNVKPADALTLANK